MQAIIFDLDGVIIDSRPWHFETLNLALASVDAKYVLSEAEHEANYDGLPTSVKLDKLHYAKGVPKEDFAAIWQRKQDFVAQVIKERVTPSAKWIELLRVLQVRNIPVVCCSNSIRKTLDAILANMGIDALFQATYANDDDKLRARFPLAKPKPHPSMMMLACLEGGWSPNKVMVCEDSPIGRRAAMEAGCCVCPVETPDAVTLHFVDKWWAYYNQNNGRALKAPPWIMTPNMSVLLPMAGRGARFLGHDKDIKPLITVRDRWPMIQVVVRNLNIQGRHIFVCQEQHVEKYALRKWLPTLVDGEVHVVTHDGPTACALDSTLLAESLIDNEESLLIANSDQFVEADLQQFYYRMMNHAIDGGILSFTLTNGDPKWSYAAVDEAGYVVEVAEKKAISTHATVGVYFWKRGRDYVKYAKEMRARPECKVNGEFYVAPVYNFAIRDGAKIVLFDITKMWGLGVPEDLRYFQEHYHGPI